jgi:hypothetical protein
VVKATPQPREPWERFSEEPPGAFTVFAFYRDLGPKRTFAQVIEGHYGQPSLSPKGDKLYQQIRNWAARFSWPNRVAAWDGHMDRLGTMASEEAYKKMRQRHLTMSQAISSKAFSALHKKDAAEIEQLPAPVLSALVEQGIRMERQAMELPESRVAHSHNGQIGVTISLGDITQKLRGLSSAIDPTSVVDLDDFSYLPEGLRPPEKGGKSKKAAKPAEDSVVDTRDIVPVAARHPKARVIDSRETQTEPPEGGPGVITDDS